MSLNKFSRTNSLTLLLHAVSFDIFYLECIELHSKIFQEMIFKCAKQGKLPLAFIFRNSSESNITQ